MAIRFSIAAGINAPEAGLKEGGGPSAEPDGKSSEARMTTEANGPDILIAGGGTAGLAAALAIARGAPDLEIEVIDARPPGAGTGDQRASAIAAAARRMLEQLGVW